MKHSVILVNDSAACSGGATKVAVTEAIGLARRGHGVQFLCGSGPVDDGLLSAGVAVTCLDEPDILADPNKLSAGLRGIWNRRAHGRLEEMLEGRDVSATIVHLHLFAKGMSLAPAHLALARGCPVVITVHDYFTACPNGGFYDYPQHLPCTRTALSGSCVLRNCDSRHYAHKLWRVARQWVQRDVLGIPRRLRHLITLSDHSENLLRPYWPADVRCHRLENPIDTIPGARARPADGDEFLFVGRFSPEKGADTLAGAARRAGVRVVMIGDGEERAALQAAYPEIEFTGWLSPTQVFERMRKARALVFPSRWHEVQPLSVLEAMSLGLPVVVSDATAAREHVEDGVCGRWFAVDDEEALAQVLRQMLDDSPAAARMGAAAHDYFWRAPARFTVDRHVAELERIYAAILDSHVRVPG